MSFQVDVTELGKYSVIVLKDKTSNTFAEIYSFGALLNQFCAIHNDTVFNVVDGFSGIQDAVENLTPFFKSAKLSPFACRVKNGKYRFGEMDYQLSKYSASSNALHGLIYDAAFEVTAKESNENIASVTLTHHYNNDLEGFPFKYRCDVEYKLENNNALTVTTTVTNEDEKLIPVADGWHPYFTLGDTIDEYQVEFQSKEMLEFDEDLIPTGNVIPYQEFGSLREFGPTLFDNCFTVNFAECQPMCVIRNKAKKIQLEFHPEKSYPYLQIYTPDHRKSIAIENLSAAPDAFNNGIGLKVLAPGEAASFSVKFVIRPL